MGEKREGIKEEEKKLISRIPNCEGLIENVEEIFYWYKYSVWYIYKRVI